MHKVDTHFHIWDLKANYYPWLTDKVQPRVIGEYAAIRKDYLITDFFADIGQTGVTKAVHVQAEHDPSDPVRETRWLQQVADQPGSRGFPQAIVAYADLGAPDAQQMLEAHCAYPNMRGIRQSLIQHKVDPTVKDPRDSALFTRNFRLLEQLNLSFDIQLFHPDMAFGADLVGRNPNVQFILTHTGLPMQDSEDYVAAWRAGMRKLAERPNLAVKISGFGFMDRQWTVDSIRPRVLETIDIFGVGRCMFASNFPVDKMSRGYAAYWSAFEEITAGFSDDERAQLFHRTAETCYRI
ncbi:MAG TPA: amidohydrolase family protein [Ramlibacter sp.]|nr:amidohydrolase family protein [Ramlibacter sp.]